MDVVANLPEKPLTIGVRGRIGAGKDTFANMLADTLRKRGHEVRREAFATPVRECLEVLTGVTVSDSETRAGKEAVVPGWGLTVRELLQKIGSDAIRERVHPDAWVKALFRRLGESEIVIISDVRFPNEVDAIRERSGVIITIDRGTSCSTGGVSCCDASSATGGTTTHESESRLGGATFDATGAATRAADIREPRHDAHRAIARLYELSETTGAARAGVHHGASRDSSRDSSRIASHVPDIIIDNSKSLDELRALAEQVAGRLFGYEG